MTISTKGSNYHDSFMMDLSYDLVKLTIGTLVRLIWVKKVEGLENIPKSGPVIIAFNHQSFFDFLCFVSICPRHIHYLSAEKFFSHKLWSLLMRSTSQIKVDRKDHNKEVLHETIHSHLTHGKVIGIFPEGTRSPHENEMLHAFTGVAKYAIKAKVPVIPVGIIGTFEVMAKHDKKPKFKKIVTFRIGKPIHFTEHFHKELNETDYRVLTDKVMKEISNLSGRKYEHYGKLEQ